MSGVSCGIGRLVQVIVLSFVCGCMFRDQWLSVGFWRATACERSRFSRPTGAVSTQAVSKGNSTNGDLLLVALLRSCSQYDNDAIRDIAAFPPVANASLSVVIVTWNRPLTLYMLLEALSRQKLVQLEVIVTDGGSWPPALTLNGHPRVDTYLYRKEDGKYHRVRAMNEAAAYASHDLLVIMDDDIVPASDYWAYAMWSVMARDPAVTFAYMPLMLKEFAADLSDVPERIDEVEGMSAWWALDKAFYGFTTCNTVIRRSAWQELGGFAPHLDGKYGGEDIELHTRIRGKGWREVKGVPYGCAGHVGHYFINSNTGKERWE